MLFKRRICERSNLSVDSMAPMAEPGCLKSSGILRYTLLKKNRVADLTTTFDEEIHASGDESASPAIIVEHAEDAELVTKAMDELPAEFREILVLRHQEGLSYKEIADITQIPPGTVMSRLARARAKLREYLTAQIGKE